MIINDKMCVLRLEDNLPLPMFQFGLPGNTFVIPNTISEIGKTKLKEYRCLNDYFLSNIFPPS